MACTAAGGLEHTVKFVASWVNQVVVLSSLVGHLILVLWSESRRREGRGWRRGILWLAYQLTDWAPTYVLGNLYLELTPHEKLPVAFWVPFLLLHLARPDNISAYVMEDSELSWRSNTLVAFHILGAIFVWYRYIYMDCTAGMLRPASGIMLFLGIFKCLESAVALWRCDMGRIRKSCKTKQPSNYDGEGEEPKLDDEKAWLVAHKLFNICECAFSDCRMDEKLRTVAARMFRVDWEFMCKVVEMELSLMYDIVYTKAALVHTWCGYAIRVASPPLTAAALVLFGLHCREDQKPGDIGITYILLGTTLVLDVIWLVRALVSTWTYSFLKVRPQCSGSFNHEVWCWGRWQQLRRSVVSLDYQSRLLSVGTCPKEPKGYRIWSGTVGQLNLFDECTGNRRSRYSSLVKIEREDHSRSLEIPELVKKWSKNMGGKFFGATAVRSVSLEIPGKKGSLFENICGKLFVDTTETPGRGTPTQGGHCNRCPVGCTCDRVVPPDNYRYDHTGCTCDRVAPSDNYRYDHTGCTCDQMALPDYCGHGHIGCTCTCDRVALSDYCRHGHTGCTCDRVALPNHCRYNHGGCTCDWIALSNQWRQGHVDCTSDQMVLSDFYKQAYYWRHNHDGYRYDLNTQNSHKRDIEDVMGFAPELQEVILILHIATNIFLHDLFNTEAAVSPDVDTIELMSDYMMFLVAERSNMLPGLKLLSLYEDTRDTLKGINKTARKTNKELAKSMPRKKGKKPRDVVWEGTELAAALLGLLRPEKEPPEPADTMKRLKYWIPDLMKFFPGSTNYRPERRTEDLLKSILDAWVRLVIYASIRCSREAHAEQLGIGGELTTFIWMVTEHADIKNVRNNFPSFFI